MTEKEFFAVLRRQARGQKGWVVYRGRIRRRLPGRDWMSWPCPITSLEDEPPLKWFAVAKHLGLSRRVTTNIVDAADSVEFDFAGRTVKLRKKLLRAIGLTESNSPKWHKRVKAGRA